MSKVAVVLLADTETLGDMGRMANAISVVQEFKEAGDEVQLIFDGAGVKWPPALQDPGHKYHKPYGEVQDKVAGVCQYCAKAFGVADAIEQSGLPFADEHKGHPSFRELVRAGYQVITF